MLQVKPTNKHADATSEASPRGEGSGLAENTLLNLKSISKTYTTHDGSAIVAVKDVSCSIRAGEFVSILGPSGCGKSTLLSIIAGLLEPTHGTMKMREVAQKKAFPSFGIVFQDPVLFPWRDVRSNIELPADVVGLDRAERRARSEKLIHTVQLSGFENKYPHELSGGMQQRVAIARALILDPPLLLMDEPFGALDALTREQLNLELQRISLASKATVIFVTHSIAEAAFLSDRVFVMTGRPSTFRETVVIDVPRPRSIDLLTSDRMGVFVSRLRALLDVPGGAS